MWIVPIAAALAWHLSAAVPPSHMSAPPRSQTPSAPTRPEPAPPPAVAALPATVRRLPPLQQPPRAVEDHIAAAANVAAPKPPGGAPPLMPAGTPARYGESAVYDALTAGLSELGADAKVTGVDCREFPCLFMGTNFGTREEADALRRTQQMSQYGDDTVVFGWADGKQADGSERWSFALAVYPHGDEERDGETMNRIGFRVDEARRAKAQ